MNRMNIRQWINIIAAVATIVTNVLATTLPLNGQNTGAISDRFAVFFVPAGYVFSIWGLIYLGLMGYAIYQALPSQRKNPRLERIGYWFALSCAANIAWLFLWHYEQFPFTIVAMGLLLLSLLVIYLRLGIGRMPSSGLQKWLVELSFSVYLGWISVATIANATSVLDYLHWNSWGVAPELWAVVLLNVAAVLATLMSYSRGDLAYGLVIAWACVGIAVKQEGTQLVAVTAWVATGWILLALVGGTLRSRQRKPLSVLPTK
jgi:hypothetical protein